MGVRLWRRRVQTCHHIEVTIHAFPEAEPEATFLNFLHCASCGVQLRDAMTISLKESVGVFLNPVFKIQHFRVYLNETSLSSSPFFLV